MSKGKYSRKVAVQARLFQLAEDCLYSSVAHHVIERNIRIWDNTLKFVPAAVAVISGAIILTGTDADAGVIHQLYNKDVLGVLAIISGLAITIAQIAFSSDSKTAHLQAAKEFTVLRHDALDAAQIDLTTAKSAALRGKCDELRARYKNLVRFAPPTSERSFRIAKKKIASGHYEYSTKS